VVVAVAGISGGGFLLPFHAGAASQVSSAVSRQGAGVSGGAGAWEAGGLAAAVWTALLPVCSLRDAVAPSWPAGWLSISAPVTSGLSVAGIGASGCS
jgi:hypothetical protein